MDRSEPQRTSGREAVTRLWREHRRWVGAVLLAHAPRGADLDDLLQEVAMALVRNIDKLQPEAVAPWLRTVAINAARTAGRRTTVARRSLGSREPLDDIEGGSAASLRFPERSSGANDAAKARGREALEVIHGLPTDYREPLLLSLRGLSHKQISLVLDLPTSTIETRLFRARAMVREEMAARESRETARPFHFDAITGMKVPSLGGGSP